MDDESDLVYLGAGPLGAVLLGMLFIPLRGLTNASNFTFAFLALTILVAEYGGRRAALATAITSTLSLDFFLTEPYLRLEIAHKDDLIAFLGLAVAGLIAAAFGSQRGQRLSALRRARTQMDLLHSSLRFLENADPREEALTEFASALRRGLPLSGVVVRNERGQVVAFSGPTTPGTAAHLLRSDELLSAQESPEFLRRRRIPFPAEGGRIDLYFCNRPVGALEVWGNGAAAFPEERRSLRAAARIVGAILAGPRPPHFREELLAPVGEAARPAHQTES